MASIVSPASGRRTMISGPLQLRIVERVQRLAAFHHHVVRDIDHVVDRRDADRRQPLRQPIGTRPHADAANHPGRVARAEIGAIDPHAHQVFHARLAFRRPRRGDRQRRSPTAPKPPARCRYGPGNRADCWSPPGRWPDRRRPRAVSSWFSPAIISRCSNSRGDMVRGTYCFSQFQETSMGRLRFEIWDLMEIQIWDSNWDLG